MLASLAVAPATAARHGAEVSDALAPISAARRFICRAMLSQRCPVAGQQLRGARFYATPHAADAAARAPSPRQVAARHLYVIIYEFTLDVRWPLTSGQSANLPNASSRHVVGYRCPCPCYAVVSASSGDLSGALGLVSLFPRVGLAGRRLSALDWPPLDICH